MKVSYALRSMSSSYFIDDAGSALMTKSHSKHLSFFSKSQDLGNMPSNLFLFWCHHRLFGYEVICLSRKVQLSNYYCSCSMHQLTDGLLSDQNFDERQMSFFPRIFLFMNFQTSSCSTFCMIVFLCQVK